MNKKLKIILEDLWWELHFKLRWFMPWWWKYLWWGTTTSYQRRKLTGFKHLWCRIQGHPHSVTWFNPGGLEPDMSCENCGDDLG